MRGVEREEEGKWKEKIEGKISSERNINPPQKKERKKDGNKKKKKTKRDYSVRTDGCRTKGSEKISHE